MNFSFKKKKNNPEQEISSPALFGCPDLDEIFEYSLPRATLIAISEDSPSKMYMSIIRSFISAGLQSKQKVLIFDENPEKWGKVVPLPAEKRIRAPTVMQTENSAKSIIAWRYDEQANANKQSEVPARIGYPYCDLSKNMSSKDMEEKDIGKYLHLHSLNEDLQINTTMNEIITTGGEISTGNEASTEGKINSEKELKKDDKKRPSLEKVEEISKNILQKLEDSLSSSSDHTVKRILLPSLSGLCSTSDSLLSNEKCLFHFISNLKMISRSSHSIILMTVPPIIKKRSESLSQIILQLSDIHITMSALQFGSQFSHFSGVFAFDKIASLTKFDQISLKHPSFGIKLSKKTCDIEPLYETPQDVTTEEKDKSNSKNEMPSKNIDF